MSDWFQRALRVCHDGPYSTSELPALYASFKQELIDRHGEGSAKEIAALIVGSLFIGARQSGDLQAYVEVNLVDLKAIREERKEEELCEYDNSYRNTEAYERHTVFQFPVVTSAEMDCESFSWYCYPESKYYTSIAEIDKNTGLEIGGFYMGSVLDVQCKVALLNAVNLPQKKK